MTTFSINDLGLTLETRETPFEHLVDLLMQTVNVSMAFLTFISEDTDEQVFKAQRGLQAPLNILRRTPLSHSVCRIICETGQTLVVDDLRADGRFKDHPAVLEFGMVAYLGVPILGPARDVIGAACAVDLSPRMWTSRDVQNVSRIADLASQQVLLKAALKTLSILND